MTPPPPKTPPPRVVIPTNSWRSTLIGVVAGIVLLLFVGYGVFHMASPVQGNRLTGNIVEKIFIPQKERQINFSGRKIQSVKEIAGEFLFKVRVDAVNQTYDVPVEQSLYEQKNVGDSLTFMRPPSEQK